MALIVSRRDYSGPYPSGLWPSAGRIDESGRGGRRLPPWAAAVLRALTRSRPVEKAEVAASILLQCRYGAHAVSSIRNPRRLERAVVAPASSHASPVAGLRVRKVPAEYRGATPHRPR